MKYKSKVFSLLFFVSLFFSIFLNFYSNAFATQDTNDKAWQQNIPDDLKKWIPWVMKDHQKNACPYGYDDFLKKICYWPSSLNIDVKEKEINFKMKVYLYEDRFIALVGDNLNWPQNVRDNESKIAVVNISDIPYIYLKKGRHDIRGMLPLAKEVSIPQDVAIINFSDEKNKELEAIVVNNKLQISKFSKNKSTTNTKSENTLKITVVRSINDNMPFSVDTVLKINVTGDVRDENLGKIIFPNSRIYNFSSTLPVKTDENGNFIFHVMPGSWTFSVSSLFDDVISNLRFFKSNSFFPSEEVWVYEIDKSLRDTKIDGVKSIAPQSVVLPENLKNMPTYLIREGETFNIVEKQRSPKIKDKNTFDLRRTIWLNFDGNGYFSEDILQGNISKDMFLSATSDTNLTMVKISGRNSPIVLSKDKKERGVIVREGNINIISESSYNNISSISYSPWNIPVNKVETYINLPLGWSIFHIKGLNHNNTWIGSWNLLNIFYVLFTTIVVCKIISMKMGILVFINMLLFHGEVALYIPILLIVLFVFLGNFLKNYMPKFSNVCLIFKNIVYVIFVISIFIFLVKDVRHSIYPSLDFSFNIADNGNIARSDRYVSDHPSPSNIDSFKAIPGVVYMHNTRDIDKVLRDMANNEDRDLENEYLDVATGVGKPEWYGKKTIYLISNSIVNPEEKIDFYYMTPNINFIICFVRAFFIISFLILILNKNIFAKMKSVINGSNFSSSIVLLSIFTIFFNVNSANAKIPDKETLNELKNYVIFNTEKSPNCMPNCATIEDLKLSDDGNKIIFNFKINTLDNVAVPIFKMSSNFSVNKIFINNKKLLRAIKSDDALVLYIKKGINDVKIIANVFNNEDINFSLLQAPINIIDECLNWSFLGSTQKTKQISLRRKNIGDAISFSTKNKDEPQFQTDVVTQSYFEIERILTLSDDFKMVTRVVRKGNLKNATLLELDLLENEHVLSSNVKVKDKKIKIEFSPFDKEREIVSNFSLKNLIKLSALKNDLVFEKWRVLADNKYFISYDGTPQVQGNDGLSWRPRNGEFLNIHISNVENAKAPLKTIINSNVKYNLGEKILETSLDFTIRSSKGGNYEVQIPKDSTLKLITIDNVFQPLILKDSKVIINLKPSEQRVKVLWQNNMDWQTRFKLPKIDFLMSSINSTIQTNKPQNRWILFLTGPKMGSCVLFWAYFPIIILVAILLKLSKKFDVKLYQWVLLFIGLSFSNIFSIFLIILWVMLFEFLKNHKKYLSSWIIVMATFLFTIKILYEIFYSIRCGLLGIAPSMLVVTGRNVSSNVFMWYQDMVSSILPQPEIFSLNIYWYKVMMIFWALWVSFFMIKYIGNMGIKIINAYKMEK